MSAILNQINSKSWTASSITEDTISEVWDFMQEAFEEFDYVTFERDTENGVMYIYLDIDKKMYIKIKTKDSGSGFIIEYWLNSEQCSLTSGSTSVSYVTIGYVRTVYGIVWGVKANASSTSISYSDMEGVYTQKAIPTMIVGNLTASASSAGTIYILSTKHAQIEKMSENHGYLSTSLDEGFAMTNAYSCRKALNLRHLFRILGIPSTSYPFGSIEVGAKRLFWFGRFALEYEEED